MEVGVTTLRSELKRWLERVASGDEVIITDHGVPVARLVGVETTSILEELDRQGIIRLPRRVGRVTASDAELVEAEGNVSDLVSEQRR